MDYTNYVCGILLVLSNFVDYIHFSSSTIRLHIHLFKALLAQRSGQTTALRDHGKVVLKNMFQPLSHWHVTATWTITPPAWLVKLVIDLCEYFATKKSKNMFTTSGFVSKMGVWAKNWWNSSYFQCENANLYGDGVKSRVPDIWPIPILHGLIYLPWFQGFYQRNRQSWVRAKEVYSSSF